MESDDKRIPEDRAAAVWHRAAQLQAEAAQRLEERSRALAGRPAAADAEGFQLSEVRAAAVEAGISPEFVDLAVAELEGGGTEPLPEWQDRAATRFLGSERRSLEVARTMAAHPAAVFEAMQRVLPAHPYFLSLRDSVGGDPLDGGVLVFEVPTYTMSNTTPFAYHAATVDVRQLQFVLRPLPGGACEVVVSSDLRFSVRRNWKVGSVLTGVMGTLGGGVGVGIGVAGMALGALAALPAAAGVALLGGGTALGYRAAYRWGLRKLTADLEGLLRAVDVNARTRGAFAPPQPPRSGGDDGTAAMMIITTST